MSATIELFQWQNYLGNVQTINLAVFWLEYQHGAAVVFSLKTRVRKWLLDVQYFCEENREI
ncbi:uncharacterized protein PHALS_12615 [Plasmopara halstedii]|uniref:Uncharacterized protein n=1 Tax=Plasmopara halstedii TaxID=4781 RepID=A0A0P1AMZ3_PLAHL|nr:uncharacterized protein PHALS_12615 [Plasmopara halstedii]CEG42335.1 hypothetical protein PHALS_12615 [Plasmopara halstedii]|eukprot:XP_024578704.1 hypothetical protein PHALS_12615 [Plasmopara halstedii]